MSILINMLFASLFTLFIVSIKRIYILTNMTRKFFYWFFWITVFIIIMLFLFSFIDYYLFNQLHFITLSFVAIVINFTLCLVALIIQKISKYSKNSDLFFVMMSLIVFLFTFTNSDILVQNENGIYSFSYANISSPIWAIYHTCMFVFLPVLSYVTISKYLVRISKFQNKNLLLAFYDDDSTTIIHLAILSLSIYVGLFISTIIGLDNNTNISSWEFYTIISLFATINSAIFIPIVIELIKQYKNNKRKKIPLPYHYRHRKINKS